MRYQSSFSERDFEHLKTVIVEVAGDGSFDANDLLFAVLQAGITNNAGDVAMALTDLEDLGYLLPLGGNPPRWKIAESSEQPKMNVDQQ
jgi:hypothetical protein